jgi:hypothetical protein
MTISSTTRTAGPFTGNGVTTLFPFAFKVFQASDLLVASVVTETGVETTLGLGTGFNVQLNSNQDANPGGTVILPLALPVGQRLTVSSDVLNLQLTEFLNQGGFYPEVITTALDRLTILVQQLQEYVDLSVQFPITDPAENNVLPSAEQRAGMLLGFDETGAPIATPGVPGPTGPAGVWGPVASITFIDTVTGLPVVMSIANGALLY